MEIVILIALIVIVVLFGLIIDRYGKQRRLEKAEPLTLQYGVEDVGAETVLEGRIDDLDVTDIVEADNRFLHFTVFVPKMDKTIQISAFVDMNRAIYKGETVLVELYKEDEKQKETIA